MATSSKRTPAPGIYRRGAGFAYVLQLGRDPGTGKRRQKWVSGFETLAEAKTARAKALSTIDDGTYVPPSGLTLTQFVEEQWLPAQVSRVRPGTIHLYKINWRKVKPRLGALKLQELTPPRLQGLYGELLERGGQQGRPLAPRSVQVVHSLLHRCLSDAVRWGLLMRNPTDLVDRPTARRPEIKVWTPAETRAFFEFAADHRLLPLWRLIAMTGLRRGEALGLRRSDVDLEGARVSVQQTLILVNNRIAIGEPKTNNARRSVDLDATTVEILRRWRQRLIAERAERPDVWHDTGFLFVDELGRPLHPETTSRVFIRLVEASGLPPIKVHGLRHSHATAMLASGISPKIAQERLGHFSVTLTLDIYSHSIAGMQANAARQVAALVDEAIPVLVDGLRRFDEGQQPPLWYEPAATEPQRRQLAAGDQHVGVRDGDAENGRGLADRQRESLVLEVRDLS